MPWIRALLVVAVWLGGCSGSAPDVLEGVLEREEGRSCLSWYRLRQRGSVRHSQAEGLCREAAFRGRRCQILLDLQRFEEGQRIQVRAATVEARSQPRFVVSGEVSWGRPGGFTVAELVSGVEAVLEVEVPRCGRWELALSEGFSCEGSQCRRRVGAGESVRFGFYERVRCGAKGARGLIVSASWERSQQRRVFL